MADNLLEELTQEEIAWLSGGCAGADAESRWRKYLHSGGTADPGQLRAALEQAARELSQWAETPLMVEFIPKLNYQSRIYAVIGTVGEQVLKKRWWRMQMVSRDVGGFSGRPDSQEAHESTGQGPDKGRFMLGASCVSQAFKAWTCPVYVTLDGQTEAIRVR